MNLDPVGRIPMLGTHLLILRTELTQLWGRHVGINLYDQVSGIRKSLHKNEHVIETQMKEATSSLSQQIENVRRIESDGAAGQRSALAGIQSLVEPMRSDQAAMMEKVDRLLATTKVNEGYLRSLSTFQTTSIDTMSRILRAELRSFVIPAVEEYLNPYKSNNSGQLADVDKNLNEIISAFGYLSINNLTTRKDKSIEVSVADLHAKEPQRDTPPNQASHVITEDEFAEIASQSRSGRGYNIQPWSQLWSKIWVFRWRIGVLVIYIRASQYRPAVRPNSFEAFAKNKSTFRRYCFVVSVSFLPASSLRIARGVSIRCRSIQDQRGFYQIWPRITTFAIVPDKSKSFMCVQNRDLAGLRILFDTGLAAPTDRTESMNSLLHVSDFLLEMLATKS